MSVKIFIKVSSSVTVVEAASERESSGQGVKPVPLGSREEPWLRWLGVRLIFSSCGEDDPNDAGLCHVNRLS